MYYSFSIINYSSISNYIKVSNEYIMLNGLLCFYKFIFVSFELILINYELSHLIQKIKQN